tara:strand:+ start:428 stop:640 length:213 start_codon:yes stop_codon:yes gene_type:complete
MTEVAVEAGQLPNRQGCIAADVANRQVLHNWNVQVGGPLVQNRCKRCGPWVIRVAVASFELTEANAAKLL